MIVVSTAVVLGIYSTGRSDCPANRERERRYAIVIGNSVYSDEKRFQRLDDVPEDAAHMADALKDLSFTVFKSGPLLNRTKQELMDDIHSFVDATPKSALVFVYFAGHGIEQASTNYLLPTDASLDGDGDLENGLDLDDITTQIERIQAKATIIVIDACRKTAVFEGGMRRPTHSLPNSIIGFPVGPQRSAASPSPYTKSLLNHLREPGIRIEEIFNKVRDDVKRATNHTQIPEEFGSLPADPIELSPAKMLVANIGDVDDELRIRLDGQVIADSASPNPHQVRLHSGTNLIEVYVYNQHTFTPGIEPFGGHQPEGWHYDVSFEEQCSSEPASVHFADREDRPEKNGPRHGKWFLVASFKADVNAETGALKFNEVKPKAWQ